MVFENKPLDEVTEEDLHTLVSTPILENSTVEYKRGLTISNPSEKKEFLADVSAFANASGGHLVLEGDDGAPEEVCGLSGIDNIDSTILRIQSLIRDGIEPSIYGVQIHYVTLANGNIAIGITPLR